MTLPVFGFVSVHHGALADGMAREAGWLADVARRGRAAAHLWQGGPGFVVPQSYRRLPRFDAACSASAAAGRPVQVRGSGGGLVPQGPGLLNLSLAWPAPSVTPASSDAIYRSLAAELSGAFARLGIATQVQEVAGSFCDGRFNLAIGGRKCVGTAQAWRRVDGQPVVLAHAVIVTTAEPAALAAAANGFEAAAGGERRYRADALTRLLDATPGLAPDELQARVVTALAERFAHVVPPHVHPAIHEKV